MLAIRIIAMPPGFAPEEIRRSWIGVTIPLATDEEIAVDPPSGFGFGNLNMDGHLVLLDKALAALDAAQQNEAFIFWEQFLMGRYLRFSKDVCELV